MTDSPSPDPSPPRPVPGDPSEAGPLEAGPVPTEDEYLELSRSLRRLAVCVADSTRADDLVQEAWLAALDTPPGRIRDLNAWLRRVLRRIASRERRRDLRRQDLEWMARGGEPEVEGPAPVELGSTRDLLRDAVAELKPHLREALEQRFFQERSVAEIAARLRCPQATVRTRLRRGIQDLRGVLDRSHGGLRAAWAPALLEAVRRSRAIAEPATAPTAKLSSAALAGWVLAGCVVLSLPVIYLLWPRNPAPPPAPEVARLPEASAPVEAASEGLPEAAAEEERVAATPTSEETPRAVASTPATESAKVEPEGEGVATASVTAPRELELVVRLENGQAASEMDAFLTGSEPMGPFHSDEEGRLRIQLRPDQLGGPPAIPGEHGGVIVTVRARGHAWSDHYILDLPPGGRRFEVATQGPALAVAGRVTDEAGLAVADAQVSRVVENLLAEVDAEGNLHRPVPQEARTDADGRYRLDGLTRSAHRLQVRAAGFLPQTLQLDGAQSPARLDFVLDRGATVAGVVVLEDGTPVPAARVWAPPPEQGGETVILSETRTDEFGLFEVSGVRAGEVWLFAHSPRDPGLFASRLLEIDEGDPLELDLLLAPTPGVRLRVVDEHDAPVAGALGMLYTAQPPYWGLQLFTDERGEVHFPHAPDVELYLGAGRLGAARAGAGELTDVRVSESTYVIQLPPRVPNAGTLDGRLLDEHGDPFEVAFVHGDFVFPRFEVEPDPESGIFHADRLEPGTYVLTAIVPGRGGIPLGTHELHADEAFALDTLRCAPPGRLELDWGAETAGEGEPWNLRFHVPGSGMQFYLVQELNEPLGELVLYPGSYVLAPPGELGEGQEPFRIESGKTTAVQVRR